MAIPERIFFLTYAVRFHVIGKYLGQLCLDMLLWHLEVVALVLVLYPWTWLGKRSE